MNTRLIAKRELIRAAIAEIQKQAIALACEIDQLDRQIEQQQADFDGVVKDAQTYTREASPALSMLLLNRMGKPDQIVEDLDSRCDQLELRLIDCHQRLKQTLQQRIEVAKSAAIVHRQRDLMIRELCQIQQEIDCG